MYKGCVMTQVVAQPLLFVYAVTGSWAIAVALPPPPRPKPPRRADDSPYNLPTTAQPTGRARRAAPGVWKALPALRPTSTINRHPFHSIRVKRGSHSSSRHLFSAGPATGKRRCYVKIFTSYVKKITSYVKNFT